MKTLVGIGVLVSMIIGVCPIQAHPGHESDNLLLAALNSEVDRPTKDSAVNQVEISVQGDYRVIRANGWPDHAPGQFPNRGNPNSLAAQNYTFRVPIQPQTNATLQDSRGAWFGVALNGVPFEPGTGEFWQGQRQWNYEAKSGFINLGLDEHNAHVQPTGAYHYHGLPTGLIARLGGDRTNTLLVGYAADGFPIYTSFGHDIATNATSPVRKLRSSWQLKPGTRTGGPGGKYDGKFTTDYEFVVGSGDLDECNGRFEVTAEYPEGVYCYHITEDFPQLARSWRGTPDDSFFKRDGGRAPGRPGERRPPPPGQKVPGAPPPRRL